MIITKRPKIVGKSLKRAQSGSFVVEYTGSDVDDDDEAATPFHTSHIAKLILDAFAAEQPLYQQPFG